MILNSEIARNAQNRDFVIKSDVSETHTLGARGFIVLSQVVVHPLKRDMWRMVPLTTTVWPAGLSVTALQFTDYTK